MLKMQALIFMTIQRSGITWGGFSIGSINFLVKAVLVYLNGFEDLIHPRV